MGEVNNEAWESIMTSAWVSERRNILLVLYAMEPTPDVLSTAMSMMERLESGVEILLRSGVKPPSPTLNRFLEDVARNKKNSRLIYHPELSWEAVVSHAGSMSDIVCILVESLEKWGLKNDPVSRRPPVWSHRLPCPLVVASVANNG